MKKAALLASAFCAIFCTQDAEARQLSSLISDARVMALDAVSSRQKFTDAQVTEFINEGQHLAISQTRCLENSTSITLTSGNTYYSLPSDFGSAARVTLNNAYISQVSPWDLDGSSRSWQTQSGTPTNYFLHFSSPSLIGFFPFPQKASDITGPVTLDYYQEATDLSLSGDQPFDNNPKLYDFHYALSYFAAGMMSKVEGFLQRSDFFMKIFQDGVATMKKRCMELSNYQPRQSSAP